MASPRTDPADRYEPAVVAGRRFIRDQWGGLRESTKKWICEFRECDEATYLAANWPVQFGRVEALEYELGVMSLCLRAEPFFIAGEPMPIEAVTDEVLASAKALVSGRRPIEPLFLQLALNAVIRHQLSSSFLQIPVDEGNSVTRAKLAIKLAFLMLERGLYYLRPVMAGIVLVQANQSDLAGVILGGYGVGASIVASQICDKWILVPEVSVSQKAYRHWCALEVHGKWLEGGEGAAVYLRQMLNRGVAIPPVAFDLCAALTASFERSIALKNAVS